MDISKYFRESLGLWDNESPFYIVGMHQKYLYEIHKGTSDEYPKQGPVVQSVVSLTSS